MDGLTIQLKRADGSDIVGALFPAFRCKETGRLRIAPEPRTSCLPGIDPKAPYVCLTQATKPWANDDVGWQTVNHAARRRRSRITD